MVVENVRAVLCRADGRKEKEDFVACWATNLVELRSGALTMLLLRAAALAKLRLAIALIAGVIGRYRGYETTTALHRAPNG